MDKTSKQIMKGSKRQEAERKGDEKYINKLKESILHEGTSSSWDTGNGINGSNDATYVPPLLLPLLAALSLDLVLPIFMVLV